MPPVKQFWLPMAARALAVIIISLRLSWSLIIDFLDKNLILFMAHKGLLGLMGYFFK